MIGRPAAALGGVVAAGAALGTGELISGLSDRVPSLVLAVANQFVAETPGGIVRWSIRTFGASQKVLLVSGVVVASLLIGGVIGWRARMNFRAAVVAFAGFGVVGGWAATQGPGSSAFGSWLSAAVAAGAGIVTLRAVLHPRPAALVAQPMRRPPPDGTPDRRWFLAASGVAATWAVAGTAAGRVLRNSRSVSGARDELAGRLGGAAAPTLPVDVESLDATVAGIAPLVTPNADFYRIDTALLVPQVDPESWTLRIHGMVDDEVTFTFDDLLAMDRLEHFVTLSCVSNEVGGDLVGNALWSGVSLSALLDEAGVHPDATQIVGRSVDGWTAGFPTEVAFDGRPAMVAITMNGEPLPIRHGFPARLVVPGLYGYVSATKWLKEIELTTWDAFDGYWIPRGWSKLGPIKTQSRIDVPRSGSSVPAGRTAVAGVAWAPTRGISKVEVRVNEEEWQEARIAEGLAETAWVQWIFEWDAPLGHHRIEVRATDGAGDTQTADRAPPAPSGATGYHAVRVDVT